MRERCLPDMSFAAIGFPITIAMMALSSIPAHAQITWTVLVIHGRTDPNNLPCGRTESYGVFDSDKDCVWHAGNPTTVGRVKYVYWDAWNHHLHGPTLPGGEAGVQAAVFDNLDVNNLHYCSVICH